MQGPTTNASEAENAILSPVYSIYTVSQKKTRHLTLVHNFTKYIPIFKILSLLDLVGNL